MKLATFIEEETEGKISADGLLSRKYKNLHGADLRGMDFSGENLSDSDLSFANLADADFSGTNLTQTNLSGTNLRGANFHNVEGRLANLSGADLSGAEISFARIHRWNMNGVLMDSGVLQKSYIESRIEWSQFAGMQNSGHGMASRRYQFHRNVAPP